MLRDRYRDESIPGGLLYYLRGKHMQGLPAERHEIRSEEEEEGGGGKEVNEEEEEKEEEGEEREKGRNEVKEEGKG